MSFPSSLTSLIKCFIGKYSLSFRFRHDSHRIICSMFVRLERLYHIVLEDLSDPCLASKVLMLFSSQAIANPFSAAPDDTFWSCFYIPLE